MNLVYGLFEVLRSMNKLLLLSRNSLSETWTDISFVFKNLELSIWAERERMRLCRVEIGV